MSIYDEICEIKIQTEGWKGGYLVKIVSQDDTTTYQISRSDIEDIVKQLQDKALEKGNKEVQWNKVA